MKMFFFYFSIACEAVIYGALIWLSWEAKKAADKFCAKMAAKEKEAI